MRKPAGGDASGLFGEAMDEMQTFRLAVPWPLVVGTGAFLLARSAFWFTQPRLTRDHAAACVVVGCAGAVVARAIALAWDDSRPFWLGFTAGLLALAVILAMTVVQLAVDMWRE